VNFLHPARTTDRSAQGRCYVVRDALQGWSYRLLEVLTNETNYFSDELALAQAQFNKWQALRSTHIKARGAAGQQ